MDQHCGACTICCKLPALEGVKAADQWCRHLKMDQKEGACTVYRRRPQGCRDFFCIWRRSQDDALPMPADLRPDKSHVMFASARVNGSSAVAAHVDPDYPEAYRNPIIDVIIRRMSTKLPVAVRVGQKQTVVERGEITAVLDQQEVVWYA